MTSEVPGESRKFLEVFDVLSKATCKSNQRNAENLQELPGLSWKSLKSQLSWFLKVTFQNLGLLKSFSNIFLLHPKRLWKRIAQTTERCKSYPMECHDKTDSSIHTADYRKNLKCYIPEIDCVRS